MLSSNFIDQHALGIAAISWFKKSRSTRVKCREKEDA
jgi:hypothetical protein